MARNRKAKAETPSPSASPSSEHLQLSEDEQWRLVNNSGILKHAIPPRAGDEDSPLADEIFNSVILIIPFLSLLLMMEILIHIQYGQQPTFRALAKRMLPNIPILSLFIFYTTRYKQDRKMQALFFLISVVVGPRMIYLINHGPWLVNMTQCPPLATVWIYVIVQLDLAPSVASLALVAGWVWWKKMKLVF